VLVGIFVEIYQDWYQRNTERIVCCWTFQVSSNSPDRSRPVLNIVCNERCLLSTWSVMNWGVDYGAFAVCRKFMRSLVW